MLPTWVCQIHFAASIMIIGVIASFLGATFQALNYALTQRCQQNHHIDGVKLLVAIHVGLGIIALLPTLLFGYWELLSLHHAWDFILINLPYLLAQYLLINAIRLSDASIASPLLALKIPVLAAISMLFFHASFSPMQWVSIGLILGIGWYFSTLSGQISLAPLLLVLVASIGYSLSDMAITQLSHSLLQGSALEQAFATICVNYLVVGICTLPLVRMQRVTVAMVYQAKWVAMAWFVAVVFLILGFNIAGVVSGNVVQSLRGVIGVLLAFFFFRTQINQPMSLWVKKLVAASGMFVAVALFYF